MIVHLNGRTHEVDPSTTLGALVDGEVSDRRGVAVAVDGEVIGRTAWDATALEDGARVEIVGAVQGG